MAKRRTIPGRHRVIPAAYPACCGWACPWGDQPQPLQRRADLPVRQLPHHRGLRQRHPPGSTSSCCPFRPRSTPSTPTSPAPVSTAYGVWDPRRGGERVLEEVEHVGGDDRGPRPDHPEPVSGRQPRPRRPGRHALARTTIRPQHRHSAHHHQRRPKSARCMSTSATPEPCRPSPRSSTPAG